MMQASAYGRLGKDPETRSTQSGKVMVVAQIAVSIDEQSSHPLWLGIVAFGAVADSLLKHAKGEMVSASGRMQRSSWTSSSGEKREQLQIVADTIISARSVRQGSRLT